ncbi:unnamed protein product, partial [Mesorhabditis spiculigera]
MEEPSLQPDSQDEQQAGPSAKIAPLRISDDFDEDDPDHHMCRVCRSDEGNLYYPCLCTGSIKYVHQECLVEWLKYSKKEVCELCNHKYSFEPIYRADMPKALPVLDIFKGIAISVGRILRTWLLYTVVLIAWVGIVPLTAARIYGAVFSANLLNIVSLPLHIFSTENLIPDCIKGIFLLAVFVITFISLVWLREQIIHGGPQEWIQLEPNEPVDPERRARRERRQRRRQRLEAQADDGNFVVDGPAWNEQDEEHEENAPDHSSDAAHRRDSDPQAGPSNEDDSEEDDDEDTGYNPPDVTRPEFWLPANAEEAQLEYGDDWPEGLQFRNPAEFGPIDPEPMIVGEPELMDPNANEMDDADHLENVGDADDEPAGQENDVWRDWDRFGDELTWQRLIGLDGSFVFIEHVFWVIALNTLFTVLFAFSPYKLGTLILSVTGLRAQISLFPSLTAILTGYVAISLMVYLIHRVCKLLGIKGMYRLLGIVYLVLKVFLLVLVEIVFFPILCGWWMDICSLSLFQATLSSRLTSFTNSPASSLFIHWMIGMVYVFYSASFVLLLREVLRPGVLWFMRNLNDPEFNPIMEMIELPITRHFRRLIASTSLFFMAILLIVFLPMRLIQIVLPSVLPYNLSLTAETPLSELSLELLILQIVLPALLEQTSARQVLKRFVRTWCVVVGRALKLDRYLLSEHQDNNHPEERPNQPGNDDLAMLDRLIDHMGDGPEEEDDAADDGNLDLVNGGGLAAEHQALLLVREPTNFEPYQRPNYFALRIVALLVALGASSTLASTLAFIFPVTVGRLFIYLLAGTRNVHELYTISSGLYICWVTGKGVFVVYEWASRGGAHLAARVRSSLVLLGYLVLVLVPALLIIPYLIGLSFQLIVVAPLRVALSQTPIYFPWQEWAMGVLHMKIFIASVMMGPEWWMRAAFEQIYQQGLYHIDVGYIYKQVLCPVLTALSMQIAVPYALAHLAIKIIDIEHYEDEILFIRFCYPFCLSVVGTVAFFVWQFHKLRAFAQQIRNEKYLVGTQLVNYERPEDARKAEPLLRQSSQQVSPSTSEVAMAADSAETATSPIRVENNDIVGKE